MTAGTKVVTTEFAPSVHRQRMSWLAQARRERRAWAKRVDAESFEAFSERAREKRHVEA